MVVDFFNICSIFILLFCTDRFVDLIITYSNGITIHNYAEVRVYVRVPIDEIQLGSIDKISLFDLFSGSFVGVIRSIIIFSFEY